MSEFIDTFVKFSNFMSRGWGFDSLFCPEGRVLYTMIVPGEGFLLSSSPVPGVCPSGGMVLDEIDTCIKSRKTKENGISHLRENGPHSSDERNPYIKTNLYTGCLRKIAIKRGTQITS